MLVVQDMMHDAVKGENGKLVTLQRYSTVQYGAASSALRLGVRLLPV